MQPMNRATGLAFGLAAALMVTACAETAVQDLLGSGKSSAPDASQVTASQSLAMPPDLQLRAPPEGEAHDNQAGAVQTVQPDEPVSTASAQPLPAPVDASQPAIPEPTTTTGTQTVAVEAPQDNYARYGISKTYPDGKPKPQRVLFEELKKAELAEKRRTNPGYGTIWNMGDLWSD